MAQYEQFSELSWRRGWDSNPRAGYPTRRFRGAPVTTTSVPLRKVGPRRAEHRLYRDVVVRGERYYSFPVSFRRLRADSARANTRRTSSNSSTSPAFSSRCAFDTNRGFGFCFVCAVRASVADTAVFRLAIATTVSGETRGWDAPATTRRVAEPIHRALHLARR